MTCLRVLLHNAFCNIIMKYQFYNVVFQFIINIFFLTKRLPHSTNLLMVASKFDETSASLTTLQCKSSGHVNIFADEKFDLPGKRAIFGWLWITVTDIWTKNTIAQPRLEHTQVRHHIRFTLVYCTARVMNNMTILGRHLSSVFIEFCIYVNGKFVNQGCQFILWWDSNEQIKRGRGNGRVISCWSTLSGQSIQPFSTD